MRFFSAAVGAALATATVVTVYEGEVVLASEKGETVVAPGQQAVGVRGQAPGTPHSRTDEKLSDEVVKLSASVLPGDQLVPQLRLRVRELEAELEAAKGDDALTEQEREEQELRQYVGALYNPSPEDLKEAAKECGLSFAAPTRIPGEEHVPSTVAEKHGLNSAERSAINKALAGESSLHEKTVRAIYIEATGDEAGASSLSVSAMETEILDKTPSDTQTEVRAKLSQERAGLTKPGSAEDADAFEQLMRAQVGHAEASFESISSIVGAERAVDVLMDLPLTMSDNTGCGD